MRLKRELQLAENHESEGGLYHVCSRIIWREFIFGEEEKVYFYSLMRKYEQFCGVQVQAFCLMSNHFHILLFVPPRPSDRMSDEEFFERMGFVYSSDLVDNLRKVIEGIRHDPGESNAAEDLELLVEKVKEPYLKRMWNLSEFVKVIKQRFTMWFNRKHGKSGTLWEGRFRSQVVQGGYAAKMTAAYIDLNPVRAGMVKDPKDYRWCSYGEAVAGGKRAQQGLLAVMNKQEKGILIEENSQLTWKDVMGDYRVILAEEGLEVDQEEPLLEGESRAKNFKKRHGFSKEEAESIKEKGGSLSMHDLIRCRTRHFTEGLVIGSREYVDSFFGHLKAKTGQFQKRKSGARKIRGLTEKSGVLFTMRDLLR